MSYWTKKIHDELLNVKDKINLMPNNQVVTSTHKKNPKHLLQWEEVLSHVGVVDRLFLSFPDNVLHGTKGNPGNTVRVWRYEELGNEDTFEEGINTSEVGMQGTVTYMHITPHEVVYVMHDRAEELGWIYRAKDIHDTNPELVLELKNGNPVRLNCSSYYDGINNVILVGEYGYDTEKTPRKMFISTNGGKDFRVLKETTVTSSSSNSHWHVGYFDVYDNRIWISEGDTQNRNLHFTDDFGETWNTVDGDKPFEERHQPTLIFGWGERVMFGRDAAQKSMGLDSYERVVTTNDREKPVQLIDKHTVHVSQSSAYAYPELPIGYTADGEAYVLFTSVDKEINTIIATGDYGKSWTSVYSTGDSNIQLRTIIGPTNEGYLCSFVSGHPDLANNSLVYSKKPEWV